MSEPAGSHHGPGPSLGAKCWCTLVSLVYRPGVPGVSHRCPWCIACSTCLTWGPALVFLVYPSGVPGVSRTAPGVPVGVLNSVGSSMFAGRGAVLLLNALAMSPSRHWHGHRPAAGHVYSRLRPAPGAWPTQSCWGRAPAWRLAQTTCARPRRQPPPRPGQSRSRPRVHAPLLEPESAGIAAPSRRAPPLVACPSVQSRVLPGGRSRGAVWPRPSRRHSTAPPRVVDALDHDAGRHAIDFVAAHSSMPAARVHEAWLRRPLPYHRDESCPSIQASTPSFHVAGVAPASNGRRAVPTPRCCLAAATCALTLAGRHQAAHVGSQVRPLPVRSATYGLLAAAGG
jgi:hypothetical protein